MTDDNIVDIYCDVVVNQMFQEIRYLQNFLQKLRPIMLSKVHRVNQSCSKIIEVIIEYPKAPCFGRESI